jgi:hypothetical protein
MPLRKSDACAVFSSYEFQVRNPHPGSITMAIGASIHILFIRQGQGRYLTAGGVGRRFVHEHISQDNLVKAV